MTQRRWSGAACLIQHRRVVEAWHERRTAIANKAVVQASHFYRSPCCTDSLSVRVFIVQACLINSLSCWTFSSRVVNRGPLRPCEQSQKLRLTRLQSSLLPENLGVSGRQGVWGVGWIAMHDSCCAVDGESFCLQAGAGHPHQNCNHQQSTTDIMTDQPKGV